MKMNANSCNSRRATHLRVWINAGALHRGHCYCYRYRAMTFMVLSLLLAPASVATNYDESKVGTYTLPDVLTLQNGQKVTDARTWTEQRRPEILHIFEENPFGRSPGKPTDLVWTIDESDRSALGGIAMRKQITLFFRDHPDAPKIHLLMYLPAAAVADARRVPVFACLSFSGVHAITLEPQVQIHRTWDNRRKATSQPTESSRGRAAKSWPIDKLLSRGYGIAVIDYQEIEPDFDGGLTHGVRGMYLKPGQTEFAPEEWGAIGAWAWGLSRAVDYLENDRDVDPSRIIGFGLSRLGKTILWAGATDPRLALVCAACSGESGAALSRRDYGETVKDMNTKFGYQFCRNYQRWGDHVNEMPMDAHMLVALMAPRPLLLSTGSQDRWSDPRGEFLAAVAASPVYELLGQHGIGTTEMPPVNTPSLHTLGFQCHEGKHEVLPWDWEQFINLADMHLKATKDASR
jgi:hypothetical protein